MYLMRSRIRQEYPTRWRTKSTFTLSLQNLGVFRVDDEDRVPLESADTRMPRRIQNPLSSRWLLLRHDYLFVGVILSSS